MTAAPAQPIMVLTDEHRDGTIYADGEGDIWTPCPLGWVVSRWLPFAISSQVADPGVQYGPYVAVIGPDGERLIHDRQR